MGYRTRYLGHIGIAPALNQAEYDYLRAFCFSRRCQRPDGPYAVLPAHPGFGQGLPYGGPRDTEAEGQPGLWCDWTPCDHGCCLEYGDAERSDTAIQWLRYLIDHFLRRGAIASGRGDPRFRGFTFDHRVHGTVVGERGDTRELFAITVRDDVVERMVLAGGDPDVPWDPWDPDATSRAWLAPYGDPYELRESYDVTYDRTASTGGRLKSVPAPRTRRRSAVKKTARPKTDPG